MSGRDRILGRVRSALEGREVCEHPGAFEGWRPGEPPAAIDLFVELFEAAGGEVMRFGSEDEAASAWVRGFVADFDGVSVGRLARYPLNHGADVDEWITPVLPHEAEVGVSIAYGAVAETGSLVMSSVDGRRAQLLPPTHVVFVDEERVFPTLTAALEEMRDELPSAIGLHSGPSKSADIGQVLVKGVHGPGRLIAVIVAAQEV